MARNEEPSVTQWACQCCLLVMANGECCDSDDHGGDGKEPLSAIPEGLHTTLGMFWHEHSEDCPNYQPEEVTEYRGWVAECDCEQQEFSWSSCDACGSGLGGSRHAFSIWYPKAPGRCPKCGSGCYWSNRTESGVDWFRCGNRECGMHYDQAELATEGSRNG